MQTKDWIAIVKKLKRVSEKSCIVIDQILKAIFKVKQLFLPLK